MARAVQISDIHQLRNFIHETLCQQNELEPGVFPTSEEILTRAGKPCGISYCLHGPRNVRLIAIWDARRNLVLFYGSTGQRLQETRLPHRLPVPH